MTNAPSHANPDALTELVSLWLRKTKSKFNEKYKHPESVLVIIVAQNSGRVLMLR